METLRFINIHEGTRSSNEVKEDRLLAFQKISSNTY
jgi:hypothetical protein